MVLEVSVSDGLAIHNYFCFHNNIVEGFSLTFFISTEVIKLSRVARQIELEPASFNLNQVFTKVNRALFDLISLSLVRQYLIIISACWSIISTFDLPEAYLFLSSHVLEAQMINEVIDEGASAAVDLAAFDYHHS